MPYRYSKVIRTLESLKRQTHKLDAIYLGVPLRSRRLDIDYPPLTPELESMCTVVRCTDFGPITKIYAGLLAETDPETVIISFDDDMVYPENMVETLLRHHKTYPDSAIGSSGMLLRYSCPMCAITPNENNFFYRISKFQISPEGRRVDSIYGYPGALYIRKFFPENDKLEFEFLNYALIDNDMFMNDDIVISGYLSMHGVERRIFPDMPIVDFVLDDGLRVRNTNEISYDLDKFFQRMNRSILSAKAIGMFATTEAVDISETIIGVSAIIVLCVLILIIFIIYIIRAREPIYVI